MLMHVGDVLALAPKTIACSDTDKVQSYLAHKKQPPLLGQP